jgi:transcriptional regulator with GAF, ATPase, and Fis domain
VVSGAPPDAVFEALLRSERIGVAVLDRQLRYVQVNGLLAAINQRSVEEHIGRSVEEVIGAYAPEVVELLERVLETGEPVRDLPMLGERVRLRVSYFRSEDAAHLVALCVEDTGEPEGELGSRLRYETTLSQVTARLVGADRDEVAGAIDASLEQVALAHRVDRLVIYVSALDGVHAEVRHVWSAGPVPPTHERGFQRRIEGPWFLEQLNAGRSVIIERLEDIPAEAKVERRILEDAGLNALLLAPLASAGRLMGAVAFESIRPRQWPHTLMTRAGMFAEILAGALHRVWLEQARAKALAELQELKGRIEQERDYLREQVRSDHGDLLFESRAMRELLTQVTAVAPTEATVLVVGETGVGKEVIARRIHAESRRADGPLIKVNCASVPDELFESEFFGHVRGAFTGAHRDRKGRFELADGGTLFLDEVGEIPLNLQAKLLRVLQEGELERVGDDRTLRVNVRLVAATNRDLAKEVEAGRFRRDLYYRLGVFPIRVPPLRERLDDVVLLARHFLKRHQARLGRRGLDIGPSEAAQLLAYGWPGNVRELDHAIERAVIVSRGSTLRLDLGSTANFSAGALSGASPPPARSAASPPPTAPKSAAPVAAPASVQPPSGQRIRTEAEMRALERANILAALEASGGKVSGPTGAAHLLGISPSTLRDRMRALGIQRPA